MEHPSWRWGIGAEVDSQEGFPWNQELALLPFISGDEISYFSHSSRKDVLLSKNWKINIVI